MVELVPQRLRRSMRRDFSTACEAVRLRGFRRISERILDLSTRGALLACDDGVEVGDEVVITFRAPGRGPWVDAVGEVCRVVEGWRLGDRGFGAGVRFTEIERCDRHELLVRLAGCPPPVPQRRRPIDYAEVVRQIALGDGRGPLALAAST